ncbi:MAG: inorganic diphosphatase [Caldilineales bacterium]|nr:inorganic diphosphatase [Caldilineales bacterium]
MQNLWRDLRTGPNAPETVYAIVEIPKGSRNKYEYNKEHGVIKLDRVLYSSVSYPGDYGLMPQTFWEDGDPFDILVMVNQPTFPGCIIEARPIGIFRMEDKGKSDDKILAVPAHDPSFGDYKDLGDLPSHFLREVEHFFGVYKDLEEGGRVKTKGWEGAAAAKEAIVQAMRIYRDRFSLGGL